MSLVCEAVSQLLQPPSHGLTRLNPCHMCAAQFRAPHFWSDNSPQFLWHRAEGTLPWTLALSKQCYFCYNSPCLGGAISPALLGQEAQLRFLLQKVHLGLSGKVFNSSPACLAPAAYTCGFTFCLLFKLYLYIELLRFSSCILREAYKYFDILSLILMDLEHRKQYHGCIYFEALSRGFHAFYFYFLKNKCIIYFWLFWVFVAAHGLSLIAASGGYSSLRCAGSSLLWLLLRSMGYRCWGFSSCGTRASVVVAHGPQSTGSVLVAHEISCCAACGIFPDQGSNPCPLHWQADS